MITIVEIPLFMRRIEGVMTSDELQKFKSFLAREPERGSVIRGTGGLRKIRWSIEGRGKSGGARVIYFFHNEDTPLFLISAFRKSDKGILTAAEKKQLKGLGKQLAEYYGQ